MTSEKYIGLDVHQATIFGGGHGCQRQAGDGIDSGDQRLNPSAVSSRTAWQLIGDL